MKLRKVCQRKFEGLFLGLDVNSPDFTDYPLTLSRLARVFVRDGLDIDEIVAFVKGKFGRRIESEDGGEKGGERESGG
jgi:hypothetical protein